MDFTKYNKGNTIDWGFDTKDFSFKKLCDFGEGAILNVKGFFITKSKRYNNEQPIAILENCLVNLPLYKTEVIKDLLADKEAIEAIKKGECFLQVKTWKDENEKKHFTCDFVGKQPLF